MISNSFVKDLNVQNPLGTGGLLASSYAELMKEMWVGNHNYVSAWDLKKIVAQVAPQFYGYQQQDSHELLSYLLDGIHEDLNKIKKKPTIDQVESDGSNIHEVAKKTWDNYLKRNQSIITDLMVGQFKSTLVCPQCKRISITFDPFMSVSLPLTSGQQQTLFSMYFINRDVNKLVYKLNLQMQLSATCEDLITKLSQQLGIEKNLIEIKVQKDHKIIENVENNVSIKYLKDHEGLIFGYEYDSEAMTSKQLIKALISMDQQYPNLQKKKFTYQRILQFDANYTFQQIHILIYQILRPFMINFLQKSKQESEPTYYKIDEDINNQNLNAVKKEYEQLMKDKQFPFKLHYVVSDKIQGTQVTINILDLPYSKDESFGSKYDLTGEITLVEILMVLSDNLRVQYMRLNRCTEFSGKDEVYNKNNCMTINECLDLFTTPETLEKGNEWYCSICKDHMRAQKTMELYKLPKILIFHMKRFKTNKIFNIGSSYFSGGSQKINTFVQYSGPDEELDMTNYCVGAKNNNKPLIYKLIGVSNHFGGLGGGHYTAYAINPLNQKWYEFNDSNVSLANPQDVVSDSAYILFYKLKEQTNE